VTGISRIRPNVFCDRFQTWSRVLARSVHPPIADIRQLQLMSVLRQKLTYRLSILILIYLRCIRREFSQINHRWHDIM
jgi:hypothetical protein